MLPPVIALVIVSLLPMSSLADERKIPHLHVDNPFYIPNPVTGSHAIYTIPLAANMHKAALEAVTLPSELEPLDLRKELNFVTELKKKGPPHAGKRSPSHGDSKQTSTSSHPIPAVSTAFLLRRVKATTVFYRGITILVRGLVLRNAGNWQLFPRRDIELWLANSAFNHVGRVCKINHPQYRFYRAHDCFSHVLLHGYLQTRTTSGGGKYPLGSHRWGCVVFQSF